MYSPETNIFRDFNDCVFFEAVECRDWFLSVKLIAHFRPGQFARQHT